MLVESLPMTQRRKGSRLLLALALAAAVGAAFLAGGLAADALSDLFGIASPRLLLAIRLLAVVAAIPAAFYLVEKIFLGRISRP